MNFDHPILARVKYLCVNRTDDYNPVLPALRRLHSYLRYIGFDKFAKASEILAQLQEINKD
jgi:hypothetical protein